MNEIIIFEADTQQAEVRLEKARLMNGKIAV